MPNDPNSVTDSRSPVHDTPDSDRRVHEGIGLCLSGGGYRAMVFHAGVLWRLNELGYLPKLDRVSSVSGGSITAAVLGLAWPHWTFDGAGVAKSFEDRLVAPIRDLAGRTIDARAIASGTLLPGTVAQSVAAAYDRHLFDGATLQDLPDRPRFVMNATNVQSGALWRFSKPYMADYRVGHVEQPTVPPRGRGRRLVGISAGAVAGGARAAARAGAADGRGRPRTRSPTRPRSC